MDANDSIIRGTSLSSDGVMAFGLKFRRNPWGKTTSKQNREKVFDRIYIPMRIGPISGIVFSFAVVIALSQAASALDSRDFAGGIVNKPNPDGTPPKIEDQPSAKQPDNKNDGRHPTDHHTGTTTSTVFSNTTFAAVSVVGDGTNPSPKPGPVPKPSQSPGPGPKPSPSQGKPSGSQPSDVNPLHNHDRPGTANKSHHDLHGPGGSQPSPTAKPPSQGRPNPADSRTASASPSNPNVAQPSSVSLPSASQPSARPAASEPSALPAAVTKPLGSMPSSDVKPSEGPASGIVKPAENSATNTTAAMPASGASAPKVVPMPSSNATEPVLARPAMMKPEPGMGSASANAKPAKRTTTTTTTRKVPGQGKRGSSSASYLASTPSRSTPALYSNTPTSSRSGPPPPSRQSKTLYSPPKSPPGKSKKSTPPFYAKSPPSKTTTVYQSRPSPALYSVSKRASAPGYSAKTTKASTQKAPAPAPTAYKKEKPPQDSSSADIRRQGLALFLALAVSSCLLI